MDHERIEHTSTLASSGEMHTQKQPARCTHLSESRFWRRRLHNAGRPTARLLAFLKGGLARLLFLHALLLEEDLALAFFEFDLEQVQQRRVE